MSLGGDMKLRSSILGALTLCLPVLLPACSDEAPRQQVGAISPPDTSPLLGCMSVAK